MQNFLVVGAGFSGAVLARELVSRLDARVLVLDERPHLGGNCHTERDSATGVLVHRYGPHIFNTNEERVWAYVNRFGTFRPFINRVKAVTARGVFSLPINLHTINQLFGTRLDPGEARRFIAEKADASIGEPKNLEEQALKLFGREIYETFFYGYTCKQWGCPPRDLPPEILKRLPVRFDYNDNYYDKIYQGIPAEGYTKVVRRILDHPRIEVRLGEKFSAKTISDLPPDHPIEIPHGPIARRASFPDSDLRSAISHIFYTGPIDAFFDYSEGRLGYRTVTFERIEADGDFQGNAVINYAESAVPFTRIHEHKHFAPWETHARTVAFREFSKETSTEDIPYYPKRLPADLVLLKKYRTLAMRDFECGMFNAELNQTRARREKNNPESKIQNPKSNISFLGRLATYRYMDMERVIAEALDFAEVFVTATRTGRQPPVFPNPEE